MKYVRRLVLLFVLEVICLAAFAAELRLQWTDNSTDEAAFAIERAEGDGEFAEVARVAPDVTTYTDADLQPATVYRYRVRAGNGAGWSDYSNEAQGQTHPNAPAAPGGLQAEPPPPVVVLIAPGSEIVVKASE